MDRYTQIGYLNWDGSLLVQTKLAERRDTKMEYVKLGNTGLDVSRICLGCMGFGVRGEGIGMIPYSPLASGRLTRERGETTHRSETDLVQKRKYDAMADADQVIVDRVAELATKQGVPRSHIALAWLLQKQPVTAPIIGATKTSHLEDAVAALLLQLTSEEITYLEEPYVPHPVVGAL